MYRDILFFTHNKRHYRFFKGVAAALNAPGADPLSVRHLTDSDHVPDQADEVANARIIREYAKLGDIDAELARIGVDYPNFDALLAITGDRILNFFPRYEQVRILSRDEEKQDALRNELHDDRVRCYIGDIRDRGTVDRAMPGVDAVFHAAALKQVPSCEFFPHEAVLTNVIGSENVIRSAVAAGVKSLVCLSTDKAVFPVNAMGMSKALMEKTAQAAARELGPKATTTISAVRYGNVMYSRGSAIPLFIRQIKSGKPITVTEPTMTRFLMPLRDSVALVHHAFANANQGDLFIKKAPGVDHYHSHNTEQLSVAGVKELLLTLPEVQAELASWSASA